MKAVFWGDGVVTRGRERHSRDQLALRRLVQSHPLLSRWPIRVSGHVSAGIGGIGGLVASRCRANSTRDSQNR